LFCLKAKARFWPWQSYVCHIRSTEGDLGHYGAPALASRLRVADFGLGWGLVGWVEGFRVWGLGFRGLGLGVFGVGDSGSRLEA